MKGIVSGLGTTGDLFFNKPSSHSHISSSSCIPSILSQLPMCVEQQSKEPKGQRLELEKHKKASTAL
ncbi:Chromatin structure-remodeling complex subunit rsc7 [Bienertia sinuspersici]